MEDDLMLGLCIIKVLCLIVIAMSLHKMAYANEYFAGSFVEGCKEGTDPRYCTVAQSGFNNAEAPVFWNAGSFSTIDSALQTAAGQAESDDAAYAANVGTGASYPEYLAAIAAAQEAAAAKAAATSGFDNHAFTKAMNGM